MSGWTKQQVIDAAWAIGIAKDKALEFYHYYKSQGWLFGNGLPIKDLASALVRWRNNQFRFEKKEKQKTRDVSFGRCCYRCGSSERYDGRTGVIWREKLPWCSTACYEKWKKEGKPKYN